MRFGPFIFADAVVLRMMELADERSKWLMILMTPAAPRFPSADVMLMLQVVLRQSLFLYLLTASSSMLKLAG
jgi:hypothetical protein